MSALPRLTVVPAGAGSGKTHSIQETLASWVIDGSVRADRIVAVTFTEAAASELRGRIRTGLLLKDRLEDALKLDQSYISTIHGFGLRILTEFALDGGFSPAPRLLSEDEESILIRQALSGTERAKEVMGDLARFGYAFDFSSKKGAEDLFRENILKAIGRLRSIGHQEENPQHLEHARKLLEELYGEVGDAKALCQALHEAVTELLERFPGDLSEDYVDVKSVCKDLRNNFRDLKRALQEGCLDTDWKLWERLRSLRLSNRRTKLPEGYDDLAQEVMVAAEELLRHPGPLEDGWQHVRALLGASQDCLGHYDRLKQEKGLLDYTDMLALGFHLLRRNDSVLQELRSRVDCLVIDEFQDTNPLQFSLLWAMHEAGVPAMVVGDLKQAIMGFQGADPRLLEQLQCQHPECVSPLTGNWRTQPKLMAWINEIGAGLFKEDYHRLTPRATFTSTQKPLEIIEFTERANQDVRAQHTAARLKALLEDETQQVHDKHQGISRRLRGGDIAVLCPTKNHLAKYASALRSLGIRTRLAEEGWFSSREVQLAYHALCLIADPEDRHAQLYLAVTELGEENLEEALKALLDGKALQSEVLQNLRTISEEAGDKTVDVLLGEVLGSLDLYGKVALWPDGSQARANLLRLQGEANEFLRANREALASGGFYGSGIKTFLSWLKARAENEDGQPEPLVRDEDAVQLMTWHSSKGKEWPIVAVCMTEYTPPTFLPDIGVSYKDFSDLKNLLDTARVVISPDFAARETREAFTAPLEVDKEKVSKRLLYVALTRAREKVILEWPGYLEGKDGVTYWHILQESTGAQLKGNRIEVLKESFPCRVTQGGKEPPDECEEERQEEIALPPLGRRAIQLREYRGPLTPDAVVPSSLHGDAGQSVKTVCETYEAPELPDLGLTPLERGSLLHRCFEIMGEGRDREIVSRATGFSFTAEQFESIQGRVEAFYRWIDRRFSPISVSREVPVLARNAEGSVISGVIDLLVETEDGIWILDHKSDVVEDLEEGFAMYYPQLCCYAEALKGICGGRSVFGVGVHWIGKGLVHFLDQYEYVKGEILPNIDEIAY